MRIYGNYLKLPNFLRSFLLFLVTHVLHVNGMLHLETLLDRWLVILLTGTELLDDTCLFKLSLELLESSFDEIQ